jgi:selenocysteine lyase/cysteine desulfurase
MNTPALPCQRELFHLQDGEHYLNCAYMAPLLRSVEEAGILGIRRRRNPSRITPRDFFEESDRVRELFAEVLGSTANRIALLPSVSYGLATVAHNLEVSSGDRIVVAHEQFPSNVYAWNPLVARGAKRVTIHPPESGARGAGWSERILESIDARTALIAMPHVHWADGTRFDLESISDRAREVGAVLVVDATQSLGAMPFDFERIQPDAVIAAGYKWLLGAYSTAYGYFGPRFAEGKPLEETWIAREGSEDFAGLVQYQNRYASGAVRFDVGERSNFTLLPMAVVALQQILDWGSESIQATCQGLTEPLLEEARELGFEAESPAWRGHHLFGLRTPKGLSLDRVTGALQEARVIVSVRGDAVRVAPNLYNDSADLEALLDALKRAVSQ